MMKFLKKHWEVLSYLIFGVLTTLLNIVLYALFSRLFGYTAANSWGNVLDNALCILFAYCTNRAFVFRSKTTGKAMAKEFGTFVTCRLGTMVMESLFGSFLTVSGSYTGAAASAAASVAGVAIIGGADGPTAVFVTTRITAQEIWGLCVKVFSNVVVVVLNYVFSKLIIFKNRK